MTREKVGTEMMRVIRMARAIERERCHGVVVPQRER
jgi:hypothetical protein